MKFYYKKKSNWSDLFPLNTFNRYCIDMSPEMCWGVGGLLGASMVALMHNTS